MMHYCQLCFASHTSSVVDLLEFEQAQLKLIATTTYTPIQKLAN
jgi:hypothetical protein